MLNFFFFNPGCFYGFGSSRNRTKSYGFLDEKRLIDHFENPLNMFNAPPIRNLRNEFATEFGADLYFSNYFALVSGQLKDLKAKGLIPSDFIYPFSFDTILLYLEEFIKFLEKMDEKEKKFFDLVLLLKKISNCLLIRDLFFFKKNIEYFEKDLKAFSLKFNNEKNILSFLNILSLFLKICRERFGSNIHNLFAASDSYFFSSFINTCFTPKNMSPTVSIDDLIELTFFFTKKLVHLNALLRFGHSGYT